MYSFYQRYRSSIDFNKNLVISGICSLILSSLFAQLYIQEQEPQAIIRASDKERTAFTNSILTLAIEYSIDIPIFAVLYYKDNRHRFTDNITGKKNLSIIKADVKKLIAAFSISEIMYDVIKVSSQYQLLQQTNIEPFQAAMISSLMAWAAFFILINISMKVLSLFEKEEFLWYCCLILSITISNSFIFFSDLETRVLYTNATVGITSGLALLSVSLLIFNHRNSNKANNAFIFLAIGLFLWFIAEILWAYYQIGLNVAVPFPSSADALWLVGYPFLIVHLYYILNLVKKSQKKMDTIKVHHIVLISLALAVVFGYTLGIVFGISINNAVLLFERSEGLGNVISIAYPVLDAILIVPAAAILWHLRRAGPQFTHWIMLSLFIVMVTVGDIGFGYSNILGEEIAEEQEWIWETFYNAGYLSIAAALFWYRRFAVIRSTDAPHAGEPS